MERGTWKNESPRPGGFVNPEYLILLALIAIGAALASPVVYALIQSDPVSTWDWASLGGGTLMIVACVVWYARMS